MTLLYDFGQFPDFRHFHNLAGSFLCFHDLGIDVFVIPHFRVLRLCGVSLSKVHDFLQSSLIAVQFMLLN